MSANKFTDEFKRDAVCQVDLHMATQFSRPTKVIQEVDAQAGEIRRLTRNLARVTSGHGLRWLCRTKQARVAHALPGSGLLANREWVSTGQRMMGFKAFHSAAATIAGIEVAHMSHKKQFAANGITAFQQFAMRAA